MKHDTWATLKADSPFEPIFGMFPKGFPLRDPFPAIFLVDPSNQNSIVAWEVDTQRLDFAQLYSLIKPFEENLSVVDVLKEGIALNNRWIESVKSGVEGFNRALEFAGFLERVSNPEVDDLQDFLKDQEERWIHGFEVPDLTKTPSEGVDSRFLTATMKDFYYFLDNPQPLDDAKSEMVGLVDADFSPERESIIIKARGASILELSNLRLSD